VFLTVLVHGADASIRIRTVLVGQQEHAHAGIAGGGRLVTCRQGRTPRRLHAICTKTFRGRGTFSVGRGTFRLSRVQVRRHLDATSSDLERERENRRRGVAAVVGGGN